MFPNELYFYPFYPFFPAEKQLDNRPPTIYSLLESIVNYGKDDKEKIKDLAKYGRTTFFDFDYPLTNYVNKETFECMILNHFLMRRIGFETFRAFNIQLNVKMNSIMPKYNKMFEMVENWDIFNDGEITERTGFDNRITENTQNSLNNTTYNSNNQTSNTLNNETSNTLNNESSSTIDKTSDRRNSELPQNQLSDLRDGNYVTNYNYDTDGTESSDESETTGSSESNTNGTSESTTNDTTRTTNESTNNTNDSNNYKETIKRSPANKLELYKEFQNNINSIYEMIFKELDDLFYGLV